jgi:hypothetical protein
MAALWRVKGSAPAAPAANPNLTFDSYMTQQAGTDPSATGFDSFMAHQGQEGPAPAGGAGGSFAPYSSAPWRFISGIPEAIENATYGVGKAAYHAIADAPQNDQEQTTLSAATALGDSPVIGLGHTVASLAGRATLAGKRLFVDPSVNTYQRGQQYEDAARDPSVTPERRYRMKDAGGALKMASYVPVVGPAAASLALKAGGDPLDYGTGSEPNVAGALGEGLTYAAIPGVTKKALASAANFVAPALQDSAVAQYSKALNPTTKQWKYATKQVVPELLDRGQIMTSPAALAQKAATEAAPVGEQIGEKIESLSPFDKPTIPGGIGPEALPKESQGMIDRLEDYKNGFKVAGVPIDDAAIAHASKLQDVVRQLGPDVSPQSLNKVRTLWDARVAKAGGYLGKTLDEGSMIDAQREGANAIRNVLADENPDLAKLNAEYHFWKGVQGVSDATAERQTGQQGGIAKVIAPIAGAGIGLAKGGAVSALGYGAAAKYAIEIARSPLMRTLSAVSKAKLASALMNDDVPGMAAAVAQGATTEGVASKAKWRFASGGSAPDASR